MKIFISWSGKPSHNIALALKEWLPLLFTGIEPFVSSEDIRKGKRWQIEIAKELESSNFGIVCLTPDNTEAPWLLFESGALSKSLKESSVSTLLTGGLVTSEIEGPLGHFQHTNFEKEDFFKLVTSINDAQPNGKQDSSRLRKVFEKFWDELVANVEKALKTTEKPEKRRSVEDMVRELLDVTNSIAKNMPQQVIPGDVWASYTHHYYPYKRLHPTEDEATLFVNLLNQLEVLSPKTSASLVELRARLAVTEYGIFIIFQNAAGVNSFPTEQNDKAVKEALKQMGINKVKVNYVSEEKWNMLDSLKSFDT